MPGERRSAMGCANSCLEYGGRSLADRHAIECTIDRETHPAAGEHSRDRLDRPEPSAMRPPGPGCEVTACDPSWPALSGESHV